MIQPLAIQQKPAWLINLLGLLLVLGTSAVLIYVFRNGPPPRMQFSALICVLMLTPLLVRWQVGWFLLYLYVPFNYFIRRFYLVFEGDNPTWGQDLMILIPDGIVALSLIGLMLGRFTRKREAHPPDDKLIRTPLGLFILLCVIEIFNPYMGSVLAGLNGFRSLTLWVFMVFITQVVVQRREHLNAFLGIVVLSGAVCGLYGAYQYLFGFPSYDVLWADLAHAQNQTVGGVMRAFSTFSFTSTFSHYMVIAFAAAAVAIPMKKLPIMLRLLGPFFLGCILMGLALTFVRSAFVGLFASVIACALLASRPQGRWIKMAVALLAVGVLVSVVPKSQGESAYGGDDSTGALVANRVMSISNPTGGSMKVRLTTWEWTIKSSLAVPAGRGLGASAAGKLGGSASVASAAYTESQYFLILSELGYPGFFLFLWINFAGFILTIRIHDRLKNPDLKWFARMSLMIQVGLLVTGIAGGAVIIVMPGGAFYWTALGLATILPRLDAQSEPALEGQT